MGLSVKIDKWTLDENQEKVFSQLKDSIYTLYDEIQNDDVDTIVLERESKAIQHYTKRLEKSVRL